MKNNQQLYLFVIFFIFIFTISKPIYSQVSNNNNELKTIFLQSKITESPSIDSTFFDSLSVKCFKGYYDSLLLQVLSIRLQEIRLDKHIQLNENYNKTGVLIKSTIEQNAEDTFIIRIVIKEDDREILTFRPPVTIIKKKIATNIFHEGSWNIIKKYSAKDTRNEELLKELAFFFVTYVDESIFRWIVENYSKISVSIGDFNLYTDIISTKDFDCRFLQEPIKKMIESELVKSEIIRMYKIYKKEKPESLSKEGAEKEEEIEKSDALFVDYEIEGTITVLNDKISIDLNCIKYPYGIILTSKNVIVDTIDLKILRYNIQKEIKEFRAIIEADFIRTDKRLFVAAFPPSKLFSLKESSPKDIKIILEIVRSFTQKLRMLNQNGTESTIQTGNVHVISDKDKVKDYIKLKTSPGEIISDLGIDYLVMINYEDIGNKIRLSAELYSADCSIGSFVDFIKATIEPKSLLSEAVDSTVINIDDKIDKYLKRSSYKIRNDEVASADSLTAEKKESTKTLTKKELRKISEKKIKEVHTPVIHDIWGFGNRWGIIKRVDPDLFLGKTASTYVELFYEYIPLKPFWKKKFEIGFEPMIGFDFPTGYFSTVLAMNTFINVKLIFTCNLRYSVLPLRVKAGFGYGAQGIRYDFSPGDRYYLGDIRKTDFDVQGDRFNYFGSLEFPISQKFGLEVLVRGIPKRGFIKRGKSIDKFIDYPLDVDNTPKGHFGGIYFVAGIRYSWR